MAIRKYLLQFSRRFWATLGMLLVFSISFGLYVRAEKQIDRANEFRYLSRALANELRQSSDDLTRMVRTYVFTGEPVYKQHYQEIIAIRDGKIARPLNYPDIYWDLVLADDRRPRPAGARAVALLDLMREAGITDEEFAKLEQAKATSDALTGIEFAAMNLVETAPPFTELKRHQASAMLHDANYHQAKAAIMTPISEFYAMTERRTLAAVRNAEQFALQLRGVVILFGLLLVVLLWHSYQLLYRTLGGLADDLHARLVRLGSGDFSTPITVPENLKNSVMGWLALTQNKLAEADAQRQKAGERIQRLRQLNHALSQCNQAIVRCTNQEELFDQICRDTVNFGGLKMAWIGALDPVSKSIRPLAAAGQGVDYLEGKLFSFDPDSPFGRGPSGTAARENRPYWCQDFQHDPATAPWHERAARFGWKASAALPLHKNGEVVGTFNLYSDVCNVFDAEVCNLLTEMAADISYALDRFELEEGRRRSQQMEALRILMLERISGGMPLTQFLPELVQKLASLLPASICSVLLLERDGRHVRIGAGGALPDFYNAAIDGMEIGAGTGCCCDAMANGARTVVQEIAAHPYSAEFKALAKRAGLAACWCEPIRSSGHTILGAFATYHATPYTPQSFDFELLEMAAHFIAIMIERSQSEANLRKLSHAVEQNPNVVIITDTESNIEYVNSAFLKNVGKNLAEVIGKKPRQLQEGRTSTFTYQDMWSHLKRGESWRGELMNIYADGQEHIDQVHIAPVRDADGCVTHYLSIQEDITEKKRSEARIQYLAHFDALTGLPNRALLDERARYALSLAKRGDDTLALIFFDLDHFKDINDSLGHSVGDSMLTELTRRLTPMLREEDTLSRLGGDEFILLLPGTDALAAEVVAQKLMHVASQPYRIGQYDLKVTASMGIAIYPEDGGNLETLSSNADAAMYRAKQAGRNTYRLFTRDMQARSVRQLDLLNALRQALEQDQLQLVYQPQIALSDERVIGVEALLRWQHPELGQVSPAEFIPVAEKSGLILPIGEWVLRSAVQQAKQWHARGLSALVMAVNLSAVQFRHIDLPDMVTRILQHADLAAEFLELELTEGVAMIDPPGAIAVMNRLHERGVRMSIDDFGTGYSSLNYLKKFKIYKLKIDQSFVRDVGNDPEDRAIVSAVIGIAKSLGLQTIAEGVETTEQLEFLRAQECDEVQGYYFSRPLTAAQFEEFFLRKQTRDPAARMTDPA